MSVPVEEQSAGYVIVPSGQRIGVLGGADWIPAEEQIAALERDLGKLFARPDQRMSGFATRDNRLPRRAPIPLSDYYVRYCGTRVEGKNVIVGKGSYRLSTDANKALVVPPDGAIELIPFGGGVHFFTVTFDPQIGQVTDFVYNAPL